MQDIRKDDGLEFSLEHDAEIEQELRNTRLDYDYDRTLFRMIPRYYEDYLESREHIETSDEEFARLYAELGELHENMYVVTASYMLEYYAKLYGIDAEEDRARWINLSADKVTWDSIKGYTWGEVMALQYRPSENLKERVLAVMSARELSSIPSLEAYIEKITGYRVELAEFNEDYAMSVYLKDGEGSSLILLDIIEILEPLVPAHIALFISMLYLRWVEFDYIGFSWDGLDSEDVTWEDLEDKDVWSKWLN